MYGMIDQTDIMALSFLGLIILYVAKKFFDLVSFLANEIDKENEGED